MADLLAGGRGQSVNNMADGSPCLNFFKKEKPSNIMELELRKIKLIVARENIWEKTPARMLGAVNYLIDFI